MFLEVRGTGLSGGYSTRPKECTAFESFMQAPTILGSDPSKRVRAIFKGLSRLTHWGSA